jgi:aminopeptidase N
VQHPAGIVCPDLVFANHGDWDYVHAPLDSAAPDVLDGKLDRFPDTLLRSMLWQGIWELVLHARLSPARFVEFVLANLPRETNDGIVPQVIASVQLALDYLRLMEAAQAEPSNAAVEDFAWRHARTATAGSDRQLVMFDAFVQIAATPAAIGRLEALLDEREPMPAGMRLDQDRRWSVLLALARAGCASIDERAANERGRDPSDQGRLRSIAVAAARPLLEAKRAWLERVLDGSELPLADLRAASTALFPAAQHALHATLAPEILAALPVVNRVREQGYFGAFVAAFLSPVCSREHLQRLDAAISASGGLHPILQRGLRNSRFEGARCLSIATFVASEKKPTG